MSENRFSYKELEDAINKVKAMQPTSFCDGSNCESCGYNKYCVDYTIRQMLYNDTETN